MNRIIAILSVLLTLVSAKAEMRADSLLLQYLRLQGLQEYPFDSIDIYTNGEDKFDAMFEDFRNARKTIDVEYFIFADDSIAHVTLNELRNAVERGVKVRLVIDGYKDHERHYGYDSSRLDTLRSQGIETYIFDPWRHPYLSHVPRDHRKIVVIDNEIGYIGGLNIADYYIKGKPEVYGDWRDTHIRITGEAVDGLSVLFENAWNMSVYGTDYEKQQAKVLDTDNIVSESIHKPSVVFFERSRLNKKKKAETRNAFIAAFNSAQDTLRIVTPYFLPTHTVRQSLIKAADRGVKIQVLFSRDGDQPILSLGNYHFSKRLLRHGADIFLYKGAFHHSKVLMIDNQFSMVGSANLNSRSLKWDYEASCFIFDSKVTAELNRIFDEDCQRADSLTMKYYYKIPFHKRLLGWFANRFLTPIL